MHVYAIQNKVNYKLYFGQTIQDLEYYWSYNIRCALNGKTYKPVLYAAIRKYGAENFNFIHIGTAQTKEELDNWEKLLILVYGTKQRKFGYNLTNGGDGTIGAERTKEWKQNISKGLKGKKFSKERVEALSVLRKGKKLSEEHKRNIGLGVKGTKKPEKWLEKLRERNRLRKGEKRKPRTPEHQAKLTESLNNYYLNKQLMGVQNDSSSNG